jgi:hypothetical protein
MLIEVKKQVKETLNVNVPSYYKDSDQNYMGIMPNETLVQIFILRDGSATVSSSAKGSLFYEDNVYKALKLEPITATEFYFALDKAAQILIAQCQR